MKKNIVFVGVMSMLLSFGMAAYTFAAIDTTPPTGQLLDGAYTNWLRDALETTPADTQTGLSTANVVKQANSIATDTGQEILQVIDKTLTHQPKLGIGIDTPQEIFDIRGATASVRVTTSSALVRFLLASAGFSSHENEEVQLFLGDTIVSFVGEYIDASKNVTALGVNVVSGLQQCPEGEVIISTDSNGQVQCADPGIALDLPDCNFNDYVLSAVLAPLNYCVLAGQSGEACILDFSGTKNIDGRCNFDTP